MKKKKIGFIEQNLSIFLQCRKLACVCILVVFLFTSRVYSEYKQEPSLEYPVASERVPIQRMMVIATAYSSDVGQTDASPCIPSNGYNLCRHYELYGSGNTIAANFLPLETQVRLPELFGDKVFIVRDRMNERHEFGRIDVWMPSRVEAKKFGVKHLALERFGGGQWRWRQSGK